MLPLLAEGGRESKGAKDERGQEESKSGGGRRRLAVDLLGLAQTMPR